MSLRFEVGTRVVCRVGQDEWEEGKIVQLWYREPDWPENKTVPYQAQLDDGTLIFVPADTDTLCRLIIAPWWYDVFGGRPGSYFARDPAADCLRQAGAGKDVNQKDHQGSTALLEAVRFKWQSGIAELLKMSADVNLANNKNCHPLHVAVTWGAELMQALLDAKADPDRQDRDPNRDPEYTSTTFGDRLEHRTPLHYCCLEGDMEGIGTLLKARASLNFQDAEMKTPLHLAIDEDLSEVVGILLQAKADMNLGNTACGLQNTPLMCAAREGNCELAMQLIEARADVQRQGRQGMGALHLAVRRRATEIVRALVAARADPTQKSECGDAIELAKKNSGDKILEVLGVGGAGALDTSAAAATA